MNKTAASERAADMAAALEMIRADSEAYPLAVQGFVADLLTERFFLHLDPRRQAMTEGWAEPTYHDLLLRSPHVEPRCEPLRTDECLGVMEERHCYSNAFEAAQDYEQYTYVEGLAYSGLAGLGGLLAVNHAWLEDEEGRVIDPTWVNVHPPGTPVHYLGMRFDKTFLAAHVVKTGWHSMFESDWRFDHQILRRGFLFNEAGLAYALGGNDA